MWMWNPICRRNKLNQSWASNTPPHINLFPITHQAINLSSLLSITHQDDGNYLCFLRVKSLVWPSDDHCGSGCIDFWLHYTPSFESIWPWVNLTLDRCSVRSALQLSFLEFEWEFYPQSASKAIFRATTYDCITYSVRWWWLLDARNALMKLGGNRPPGALQLNTNLLNLHWISLLKIHLPKRISSINCFDYLKA